MLSRLYEWYRVVSIDPTDEKLEKRKKAVVELVASLKDGDDFYLASAIAIATCGIGLAGKSAAVRTAIDAIKKFQPAFPQDIEENALEVQVVWAIAVGELLENEENAVNKAWLAEELTVSALEMRPRTSAKYLQQLFDELLAAAKAGRQARAEFKRKRLPVDTTFLNNFDVEDEEMNSVSAVVSFLKAHLEEVDRQASADREELDLLWWFYSAVSAVLKKPLCELAPPQAAAVAGLELANRVMLPPLESVSLMVRRAAKTGKIGEQGLLSLEGLIQSCDDELIAALAKGGSSLKLIQSHPGLFPVASVCLRVVDSSARDGWQTEYEKKVGRSPGEQVMAADWAVQIFNETVAKRAFDSLVDGE